MSWVVADDRGLQEVDGLVCPPGHYERLLQFPLLLNQEDTTCRKILHLMRMQLERSRDVCELDPTEEEETSYSTSGLGSH